MTALCARRTTALPETSEVTHVDVSSIGACCSPVSSVQVLLVHLLTLVSAQERRHLLDENRKMGLQS